MNTNEDYNNQEINDVNKKSKKKSILLGFFFGFLLTITLTGGVLGIGTYYIGQHYNLESTDSNNSSKISKISSENVDMNVSDIYKKSVASVVTVVNMQKISSGSAFLDQYLAQNGNGNEEQEAGVGSGFIYKKENGYYYAVTNYHVVEGSDSLKILLDSSLKNKENEIDAEVVGSDELYDLAVVKFKSKVDIKPLTFVDSDKVITGEEVVAIGSPYGEDFQGSVSQGIISAPVRKYEVSDDVTLEYFQTDTAINPGNSGGPLIDANGNVVGINSMKIADMQSDNMGFAIPSNQINKIIEQIEKSTKENNN